MKKEKKKTRQCSLKVTTSKKNPKQTLEMPPFPPPPKIPPQKPQMNPTDNHLPLSVFLLSAIDLPGRPPPCGIARSVVRGGNALAMALPADPLGSVMAHADDL